jgi:tetraacyldisaccharide 4'-kinase
MGRRKYFILYPFSLIYRIITDLRNFLFDSRILHPHEFSIPIISVGNITVGGTGKTPHVEYLVELLRNKYKVAVLSRGYKRRSKDFRIIGGDSSVWDAGDEPLQIAKKFPDVLVAVDRDRVHGTEKILNDFPGTGVIILDDAYQHRRIKPGLSILLSDFNRPLTRDHLMPYGRLRERRSNRKRADIILISKTPPDIPEFHMDAVRRETNPSPQQKLFFTSVAYFDPLPLFKHGIPDSINLKRIPAGQYGIVLITAIADPSPLKEYLRNYFTEIIHIRFPDHHFFQEKDILNVTKKWNELKSPEKLILTTEKDSIRLRESTGIPDHLNEKFYFVPVKIMFFGDDKQKFDNLILEYVGKNKRVDQVPAG